MIRAFAAWLLLSLPAMAFPVERCVNLADALEAPTEGDWGYRITDADIAAVANAGFDTIRLPVRFSNWIADGQIDPALLARVDHVIRTAQDNGLTVILDLHHFRALMVTPNQHADTFVQIWAALSDHYAGWPQTLMFELLNEPQNQLTTTRADALFDRVIPIIRQRHPDRWIIVGGGDWSAWQKLDDLKQRDARVAYTFHYYTPFEFTHQEADWTDPMPPKRGPMTPEEFAGIEDDFKRLSDVDRPLFLGEFGVYHKVVPPDQRAVWMTAVRRNAENAGIPWCHWGYASGFRLVTDDRAWIPGLKDALFAP